AARSACEGKIGAANAGLIAGAKLLATVAVEHVQRDAGSSCELPGERPSTNDLVQDLVAASKVMSLAERQVIDIEQVEGVPAVKLRWTVIAMGVEVVRRRDEHVFLREANRVKRMGVRVVSLEQQATAKLLAYRHI